MIKVQDRFYGNKLTLGDTAARYYNEYNTQTPEDWFVDMLQLKQEAESQGYTDVEIGFKSTLEPYEDGLLGPVQMFAEGYRDKTPKEIEREAYDKKLRAFAKEKGCTYYEANQFFKLQEKGLV